MGRKQEIITFKVDEGLFKAIEGIPNRSDFIRAAPRYQRGILLRVAPVPAGATTIVLAGTVYLALVMVPRFFKLRRS